jgi:hypothetical protein
MSKFDSIFTSLYEDVAGASPTTSTPSTTSPSTSTVTASTPATNTPAGFNQQLDQQHIQALAGISNVQGIQDYLKKNNLQLAPVQQGNQSQVTPTPNAA